jgi:DNA polymerase-3 subunit gamma/tau
VVSADQVRDMLGLADRGRIFDLFDSLMGGDIQAALAVLDDLYNAGADPVVVMQDLLDLTHWLTRLKLVPDAGTSALTPEAERVRGRTMAGKLAMPVLARTWQMLLKGLQETQSAPSPIRAAEMALVRIAYAADLPSPADALRGMASNGGGAKPAASPRAGNGAAGNGSTNAVGRSSVTPGSGGGATASAGLAVVARSEQPQPVAAAPQVALPATAEAVLALLEEKREMTLANHFLNNVHVLRCEAGRLEFRPAQNAPSDLANKLGETLTRLTGTRWVISVAREGGDPTIATSRATKQAADRASATAHPLVQAVLAAFPNATIERVRPRNAGVEPESVVAATDEDDFGYDQPLGEDEL